LTDAIYFSIVTVATVSYGILPRKQRQENFWPPESFIITGEGTFLSVFANSADMLLNRREKELRKEKLNMVIGVFFEGALTSKLLFCLKTPLLKH
jgi:hypothetical protein